MSAQSQPCWWCQPKVDPHFLAMGPGLFRDLDYDFSYGIPVCGGCGGLGLTYDDPDFKVRTKRIMDLRFEFCPVEEDALAAMTPAKKLEIAERLATEVRELANKYGLELDRSYAKTLVQEGFDNLLESLRHAAKNAA